MTFFLKSYLNILSNIFHILKFVEKYYSTSSSALLRVVTFTVGTFLRRMV